MARKDVDLVIRAKDEAAGVVDTITKALNEFVDAQASLDTRAKRTESSLGQLGAALGTLDKALKGIDVGKKLTADLDGAAAALGRLDAEVQQTRGEVSLLSKEFTQAESSTTRFTTKLAGATAAMERQKTAIAKAKVEQRELTAAYDQSVAAQEKIAKRQNELPALIEKQAAALAKTKARYSELSDEIISTEKPSATLVKNLESSTRAMTGQESKLAALRAEYAATDGKLRAASAAVTIFAAQSASAAASLAKQERALQKITQNYNELGVKTKAAATNQKALDDSLDKITGKLNRQSQALSKAEDDYVGLALAAGQADAALENLSRQSIGNLQGQLDAQRRAMLEAKREYVGLTDASSKLAAEIGRAGVPTREMAEAFARTKAQAASAKAEYQSQRETLLRMGQAFRQAGTDIESIRGVQAAFAASLATQGAATDANRAKVKAQVAEIKALHAETTRAASSTTNLGNATRRAAADAERNAKATSSLAQAYRQLYGDTRQSLSLTQRLRGEVLSLIAAYGGLYGVINLLGQVITAYQTLEAAQARLNVVNDGDFAATANDLDFLRRNADRLGVDLGTLAQEYSKFSIATKGTNLEGEKTRKIFISVAEAARVNRTSNEELSGVFVALTQIVSKGAVQMEELRQQLGDRLPGALQIMADGLGVTTAELIKMLEAGEVTSDALVPFAEELDRRFGPGLGEALAGTTTALGRLKNAAFQALVQFGNGGFIESFTRLANDLTELLQSADFETFVNNASAAFATLIDALAFLVRNFDLVVAAGSALIGLKLAPVLVALASSIRGIASGAGLAATGLATIRGAVTGAGVAAGTAAGSVGLLAGAMRLLLSSTGIGLIISAVAAGIGLWSTNADLATEAMNNHLKIMDDVKNAYDLVGGSVDDWREKVEELTVTDAKRNLEQLVDALEGAKSELDKVQSGSGYVVFGGPDREYRREIEALIQTYEDGQISASELLAEVDKVNQKFAEGSRANEVYGRKLVDAIKPMIELETSVGEAEQVVIALTGTTEEAADALENLGGAAESTADDFESKANAAIQNFTTSMEALKELLPTANSELGKLGQTVGEIDVAFQNALKNARAMPDAIMRIAAEQQALATANAALMGAFQTSVDGEFGNFSTGIEAASAVIREFEGFRATPYWDVNALRAGFGSDTITLADGSVQAVVEGISVSVADANRDLARRIAEEFMPAARDAVGAARFDVMTPQQQAALTSLAYNYGAGAFQSGEALAPIAAAIREGNDELAAALIAALPDNPTRRGQEAALYRSTAGVDDQVAEQERLDTEAARLAAREAELRAEEDAATQERLANGQFEIEQQEKINAGKERQAAIDAAIRAAKAEDPNITQAELDAISEQTGKLFDLEQQQKNVTTAKEKAAEADALVNQLLQQRQALEDQLEIARTDGDVEKQEELRAKIAEINEQYIAAIENAKAMWAAVGGQESVTAIEQLNTATLTAQRLNESAKQNYLDWSRVGDMFVTGLAGAFNTFARAVAEGQSVGEAARDAFLQFAADFLIQIAQMIIQQAIFNALQGAFGGTKFGALIGVGHTGGVVGSKRVGSGNSTRRVSPAMFAGAPRYHEGGIVGLRPGEVPIIAKEGEAMLTEDDPYHPKNRARFGTGGGVTEVKNRIINAIDGSSFLDAALSAPEGERVMLNWMRANADAIKSSGG